MSTTEWLLIALLAGGAVYLATRRRPSQGAGTSSPNPYTVQYQPAVHQEPPARTSNWSEDFRSVASGVSDLAQTIGRFV